MISFTLSNNKTFLCINDLDRVFFVVCKVLTTNIADMRCIGLNKRYSIADQHLARHFKYYSAGLSRSPPLSMQSNKYPFF